VRLKSELWVKAYIRRCAADGRWAVVARKGDPDAGSVFVRVDLLDGRVRLFGPPPGSAFGEDGERRWVEIGETGPMAGEDAAAYLDRRASFDQDIWIVDLEARDGESLLENVTAD
jgi:hypothetical protein